MSFLEYEQSVEGGSPVELYKFKLGSTFYYYTSANEDFVDGVVTYQAHNISRSNINQSSEGVRNDLTLDTTIENDIVKLFQAGYPSFTITLEILRTHLEDPAEEKRLIWSGVVLQAREKQFKGQLTCRPFIGFMKQQILRPTYQKGCNHTIYDTFCGLDRALLQVDRTVAAKDGLQITVTGLSSDFADGELIGGLVVNNLNVFAMIQSNTGDTLTLFNSLANSEAGNSIKIAPGCQQLPSRCKSLGNYDNYFGFPDTPNVDLHGVSGVKGDS